MEYPVNLSDVTAQIEFHVEVKALSKRAKEYLLSFKWCNKIYDGWLYTNIGYALCIFVFKIENTQSKEDDLLWVVAGDFPFMYLDTYGVLSTKDVLQNYVRLAEDFINNAKKEESLEECYPFDFEPTNELLPLFEKRINLIKVSIIDEIEDIFVLD